MTPGSALLAIAACARAGKRVCRTGGLVDDRGHLVVIPTVGIVIGDHDGGVVPLAAVLLQEIDDVNDERLLVERIGIAGVGVLISRQP